MNNRRGFSVVVLLAFAGALVVAGSVYLSFSNGCSITWGGMRCIDADDIRPIACTEEARICPDGSAVARIGPKCEFASCPELDRLDGNECAARGGEIVNTLHYQDGTPLDYAPEEVLGEIVGTNCPCVCVKKSVTSDWKTYHDRQYGFSFKYPPSLQEKLDGTMMRFSDSEGTTRQGYFLRILERGKASEFSFIEESIKVENIVSSIPGFTAYSVQYKTPPYGLAIPLSDDAVVILGSCDCLIDFREQIFSTFQRIEKDRYEQSIIDEFLREWPELQKSLPFRPVLGSTKWHVGLFQFIAPNRFLVTFDDGHLAAAAFVDIFTALGSNTRSFSIVSTLPSEDYPRTEEAWRALVIQHGGFPDTVRTYVMSVVRDKEIMTFNGWTEVPENPFISPSTINPE